MLKNIIISISVFIIAISFSFAQDTIVKKDETVIPSYIKLINDTIVKYKRAVNINGPTYILLKKDVKKIIFDDKSDGTPRETSYGSKSLIMKNNKILLNNSVLSRYEILSLYNDGHREALSKYNTGYSLTVAGQIIAIPGAVVFGYGFAREIIRMITNNNNNNDWTEPQPMIMVYSGAAITIGFVFSSIGRNFKKKSVEIYNREIKNISNKRTLKVNFGMTDKGVGLCVTF